MTGEIIAIALGLFVGLSLGALGGGGSTLAVPILVFVAGLQAQDATTASLLVVGVASAFGVVSHLRHGNVRLGTGIGFGAAGIVGSRIGLLVNRSIDENVLLLAFSVLIIGVAIRMYRSAASARLPMPTLDGTLATVDIFYDTLRHDIERSDFKHVTVAVLRCTPARQSTAPEFFE